MRFLIQFENCEVAAHKGPTPQTMSIHPSPTASPMPVLNWNSGHAHGRASTPCQPWGCRSSAARGARPWQPRPAQLGGSPRLPGLRWAGSGSAARSAPLCGGVAEDVLGKEETRREPRGRGGTDSGRGKARGESGRRLHGGERGEGVGARRGLPGRRRAAGRGCRLFPVSVPRCKLTASPGPCPSRGAPARLGPVRPPAAGPAPDPPRRPACRTLPSPADTGGSSRWCTGGTSAVSTLCP